MEAVTLGVFDAEPLSILALTDDLQKLVKSNNSSVVFLKCAPRHKAEIGNHELHGIEQRSIREIEGAVNENVSFADTGHS